MLHKVSDVVDQCRLPVQPVIRGIERRFLSRHRRTPLHGFQHGGFFAGHIAAVALEYLQVDVDAAAENVFPDEPPFLGLRQCLLQIFSLFVVFMDSHR